MSITIDEHILIHTELAQLEAQKIALECTKRFCRERQAAAFSLGEIAVTIEGGLYGNDFDRHLLSVEANRLQRVTTAQIARIDHMLAEIDATKRKYETHDYVCEFSRIVAYAREQVREASYSGAHAA